jgi:hypothetical protein
LKNGYRTIYDTVMAQQEVDKKAGVDLLNQILETEPAGIVRYTHYSLMAFGHSRIPHCQLAARRSHDLPGARQCPRAIRATPTSNANWPRSALRPL